MFHILYVFNPFVLHNAAVTAQGAHHKNVVVEMLMVSSLVVWQLRGLWKK